MKRIMILRASEMQLPAILKAKEMGFHVVAVDSNPAAVGFQHADEKVTISAIDIPAVVDAAKRLDVDGVLTLCTDMPVRTVAAVAEALGLPAISVENSIRATDKVKMRETLKAHGVPIPSFFEARDEDEFLQAVQKVRDLGCKCIVKPADSCGSRGVVLLDRFDGGYLEEVYRYSKGESTSGDVIVEEYMEGPEVCVESLCFDGVCYPIQITDKLTTGAPYFVEMGHSQPSTLPASVQEDIYRVTVACNMALGNFNGSSCTEIKVTENGAKVVEMGARLAGDFMTTDLVPLSCGVDMVESIIRIALGEAPIHEHAFEKASAIRFFETDEGVIEQISGVEEAERIPGVTRIGFERSVGDAVGPIQNSSDRVGYVIAEGSTPDEAVRICEMAMERVTIKVKE